LGYGFANPENTEFQGVAYEEMWDAILNGEYTATVRGKVPCDIRMIYRVQDGNGGNALNQSAGIVKGIEAYRKVEFVVASDIVLATAAKYADVVLPTTTPWEQELGGFLTGNTEMLLWYNKVTEPLFEARDCQWIERELATRLELNPDDIYPFPPPAAGLQPDHQGEGYPARRIWLRAAGDHHRGGHCRNGRGG